MYILVCSTGQKQGELQEVSLTFTLGLAYTSADAELLHCHTMTKRASEWEREREVVIVFVGACRCSRLIFDTVCHFKVEQHGYIVG